MFKRKIKNISLLLIFSYFLFFISSKGGAVSETIYDFSLNWQKIIKDFLNKVLPQPKEDSYKEKYYQLLEELAKLKLTLFQIKDMEIILNREKYLPNLIEAEILKVDSLGYIYSHNSQIKENMIAVDKRWSLVGKVSKVTKNYAIINSLNVPGIEFNVSNLEGKLLGLGRTISNGFLEVNFVDPDIKVNLNDFILTYGDDIFPAGFLVGTISKINKTESDQQIIVKLTFNLDSGKIYFLK